MRHRDSLILYFFLRLPCCCQDFPERACSWELRPRRTGIPGCDDTSLRLNGICGGTILLSRNLFTRRGRVPSGAAEFLAHGGMGASAPIFLSHRKIRMIRPRPDISGKVRVMSQRFRKMTGFSSSSGLLTVWALHLKSPFDPTLRADAGLYVQMPDFTCKMVQVRGVTF